MQVPGVEIFRPCVEERFLNIERVGIVPCPYEIQESFKNNILLIRKMIFL